MWIQPEAKELLEKYARYAKVAGVIFIVLGILAFIYPMMASVGTAIFVAWFMFFAGISAAYFTYATDKRAWQGWLKSCVLIVTSLIMLLFPLSGVAALGMLFAFYFFMDAVNNVIIGMHSENKFMWLLNAVLSFLLGAIFIASWPFDSFYLVGLMVGISLIFDGIGLFAGGNIFQKGLNS